MNNSVAWITLIIVLIIGLSDSIAQKSLDQSSRNASAAVELKTQRLNEASSPQLGSARLENPNRIQELLLEQQQINHQQRVPQSINIQ